MKPIEFCEHVENTLGWNPPPALPRWRALTLEANRLTKKRAINPALYSWEHLLLAVELLRRRRLTVSPTGVCGWVIAALREANAVVTSDMAVIMNAAVMDAFVAGEPEWVERLSRAVGDARQEVLDEWRIYSGAAS